MTRAALLLLLACGHPASLREPAGVASYCFALQATHDGDAHYARACADTLPLCTFARDRAIALARLVAITEVGQCRWEASR